MTTLHLIVNPTESYLLHQRDKVLKEAFGTEEYRSIPSASQAGARNLFGSTLPAVLRISTNTEANLAAKQISELSDTKLKSGLVVLFEGAARSCKKLIEACSSRGQVNVFDSSDRNWNKSTAKNILAELHIPKPVKEFLLDWAGEDYEQLLSISKTLGELSPRAQSSVSIDAVLARLPLPPGSVPPWEIEQPLLAKNTTKTIEMFRRIVAHSSPIVVSSILSKKFEQMYRILSISGLGLSKGESAALVGASPGQMYYLEKSANRIGLEKLEKLVMVFNTLHGQLTTGASTPKARAEVSLLKAVNILNSR